jgi:hypothetical protein
MRNQDKKILGALLEKYGTKRIMNALNENENKHISFSEFNEIMWDAREAGKLAVGVIVFKKDNWKTEYSLESRSYRVNNIDNYFDKDKISQAWWASNLDGTDNNIRLDYYINDWKIDYCYILNVEE